MPLSEFTAPEITDQYLQGLSKDQLIELLLHKTQGLIASYRSQLTDSPTAKVLGEEVKKIQHAIENFKESK